VRLISHELRSPLNAACLGLNDAIAQMIVEFSCSNILEILSDVLKSCEFSVDILEGLLSAELLGKGLLSLKKTSIPVFNFVIGFMTPFHAKVLTGNYMLCFVTIYTLRLSVLLWWISQTQGLGLSLILNPDRQVVAALVKDVVLHGDKARLGQLMNTLVAYVIGAAPRGSEVRVGVKLVTQSLSDTINSRKSKPQNPLLVLSIRFLGGGISPVSLIEIVIFLLLDICC
jgi:hypothetical protein